jgi:hypothetical protein
VLISIVHLEIKMPGLMALRPMAATSKARRGTSRLTEKMAEEREHRKPAAHPVTHFRAASSKVHPINMPHVQSDSHPFRSKQVTDPLPDNVRARLVNGGTDAVDVEIKQLNYSSSGSEHEPSSMCLAAMVHEFMEEVEVGKCGRARCNCESGSCNGGAGGLEDDDTKSSLGGELSEVLQVTFIRQYHYFCTNKEARSSSFEPKACRCFPFSGTTMS